MEEVVGGRRFHAGEIGIQMKHVARNTPTVTFLTLAIVLSGQRTETENSWRAPANKNPVWGGTARSVLGLQMFYELFIRALRPAVSKRREAVTSFG
jgi:hypothetical protein